VQVQITATVQNAVP